MLILTDTRETLPYTFTGYDCQVEAATLATGDYSLKDLETKISLERKSLPDLIGCLTVGRDRFEKELRRARPYEFFAVVVEATLADVYAGKYQSAMTPQSALQSIIAFEVRYKIPFVWAGNRRGGEYMVHSYLSKYLREIGERFKVATNGQEVRRDAA